MKTAAFMAILLGLATLLALGPPSAEGIICFDCNDFAPGQGSKTPSQGNSSSRQDPNLTKPCPGNNATFECDDLQTGVTTCFQFSSEGKFARGCGGKEKSTRCWFNQHFLTAKGTSCWCNTALCNGGHGLKKIGLLTLLLALLPCILA